VARTWARDKAEEEEFFDMIVEGRAIPNTPAIANAGRDVQMGSACFVLPVEDDTDAILQTLRDATIVHKYGGGTGFDFTPIRSRNDIVKSTGRRAPGPVEGPLKGYSEWLARWSQAGIRNGANMGMLHVDHPDVLDFVYAKREEGVLTNFNLSVQLTHRFMHSLDEDGEFVWAQIVTGAWNNGEPGAFFIDTVNNARLHPETLHGTNPCGEVPLLPNEACVLGSVNLAAHVTSRGGRLVMHEPNLRATVKTLTRMLDNIIDAQDYPTDTIRDTHRRYRKIGVGVMGFADALAMLDISYNDELAVTVAQDWARIIQEASYDESGALAVERGAYPAWYDDKSMPFRRNLNAQVIAPTGSIARIIPNHYGTSPVSFGIEPHFDVDTSGGFRSFVVGGMFEDHNPFHTAKWFTPASRVDMFQHVLIQAAFQRYVDQAVSKTVNLPHSATRQDVADVMRYAWSNNCKGITVLRSGSRDNVVIDCNGGSCQL
jgi:ribonucleoside-diphosphate reductase alpha chain